MRAPDDPVYNFMDKFAHGQQGCKERAHDDPGEDDCERRIASAAELHPDGVGNRHSCEPAEKCQYMNPKGGNAPQYRDCRTKCRPCGNAKDGRDTIGLRNMT